MNPFSIAEPDSDCDTVLDLGPPEKRDRDSLIHVAAESAPTGGPQFKVAVMTHKMFEFFDADGSGEIDEEVLRRGSLTA